MAKYIQKELQVIEAEQFLPSQNKIPKGVFNVYQMGSGDNTWFTGEVWTIQAQRVRVREGEWIVTEPNNPERHYPIANEVFINKYQPLP